MKKENENYCEVFAMDFKSVLKQAHEELCDFSGREVGRLEFLAEEVFEIVTYESEASKVLAVVAIDVAMAISKGETFEFIKKSDTNRMWFYVMCNMPFFARKISWGTSIRGAFWSDSTEDAAWLTCYQVADENKFVLNKKSIESLVDAIVEFAGEEYEKASRIS